MNYVLKFFRFYFFWSNEILVRNLHCNERTQTHLNNHNHLYITIIEQTQIPSTKYIVVLITEFAK